MTMVGVDEIGHSTYERISAYCIDPLKFVKWSKKGEDSATLLNGQAVLTYHWGDVSFSSCHLVLSSLSLPYPEDLLVESSVERFSLNLWFASVHPH